MTNEEMAAAIRAGDVSLIQTLWEKTERYIAAQAAFYAKLNKDRGGVTDEDLYQCGYIALTDAVKSFEPDKGMTFIGWLKIKLRSTFAGAYGYKTTRERFEPLNSALSFSEPIENEYGETLGEIIPEEGDLSETVIQKIWLNELQHEIQSVLKQIPDIKAEVLRERYFNEKTSEMIAEKLGISAENARKLEQTALRTLRKKEYSSRLLKYIEENTNYYLHTGLKHFKATKTSSVEEIVLRREKLRERHKEKNSI